MKYYFISLILSLLFCFFSLRSKSKILKILFACCSMLPFFFVAAFRAPSVGIDTWKNYIPTFNFIVEYKRYVHVMPILMQKYSIGFAYIFNLLAQMTSHSQVIFILGSFVIVFFTFAAIYQQSKNKYISIILFLITGAFLLSMNGMRSYMACAIVLFSLKYIYNKNFLKFLIFILIASSVHSSAIIFILLYPLYNYRINSAQILILLGIAAFSPFFIEKVFYFLLKNTSYRGYFASSGVFINPLYTMLIINIILFLLFLSNYKRYKTDYKYNFYLKLQLISIMVCIFSFVLTQSYRLEQMIDFFQILTIPYNLHLMKKNEKIIKSTRIVVTLTVLIIYSIYFTRSFIFSDDNQVKNYVTIFEYR